MCDYHSAIERQNLIVQSRQNKNPVETIERDYRIAAKVVELYGDKYVPGFIRVHKEIQKHLSLIDARNLALEVARKPPI